MKTQLKSFTKSCWNWRSTLEAPFRTQTHRADGDTEHPPCALESLSRGVMSPVVDYDWPSPAFQSHL